MTSLRSAWKGLREKPSYALMRGAARSSAVRSIVVSARNLAHSFRFREYLARCRSSAHESMFPDLDVSRFVDDLRLNGIAFPLRLPAEAVRQIHDFAANNPCYADRIPAHGFMLDRRDAAESRLKKPILLAQYFNVDSQCEPIARLSRDPVLREIAARFLRSVPTFVGTNLWWTFAVDALSEDRDRHAHLFHRDVDDFSFMKFFFYITEVAPSDGAHVCVRTSQRRPLINSFADRWSIRRYTDEEVSRRYAADDIMEITGPAGSGFAENTLCIHKGQTPVSDNRLLLQLQFSLFDYGVMHDRRESASLGLIA